MAKIKLNEGHWHEAMDRSYCVGEIIESMLVKHPAIASSKSIKAKVLKAQELIAEVYLECGSETFSASKPTKK